MSGKSTLLRTLGTNTVLALAGAPVRARRLRLTPLQVGASIRVQDSLQAGASRFYAEITRLRQIVELTEGALPVLFLLDEILHGTNSHDRRIGAEGVVRGLVERGWDVSILHRGHHERAETPRDVRHLHHDPYDDAGLDAGLAGEWDLVVAMYGRLRRIAQRTRGRAARFVSVGGVPAVRGWMNPWLHEPAGLPVPVGEDAPTVRSPDEDEKGYRVARTEEVVLEHHPAAVHLRYPYAYGPYQLVPREWCVVRRLLDGRRRMIVPDDGLTLHHHGYTENLAHAVLLAADDPGAAAGHVVNAGDEEVLSIRQVVELCAAALEIDLELVSVPWDLAAPARPLLTQPLPTHRVLDLSRIKAQLGYRDVVPAREAVGRTARWLAAHPIERGAQEEVVLADPFDYAAEDALMDAWLAARASVPPVRFGGAEPGYGLAYSGPGGRPRTARDFT
jgi:nucleoside-diphosphate-sugar epimerase